MVERLAIKSLLATLHSYLKEIPQGNIDPDMEANRQWYRTMHEKIKERPMDLTAILVSEAVPFVQRKLLSPEAEATPFDSLLLESLPEVGTLRPLALRHRLNRFLPIVAIKLRQTAFKDIDGNAIADETTEKIREWHGKLEAALNLPDVDVAALYDHGIKELQEILKDPMGMALDSQALLGSDGNVYGTIHLTIILNELPVEERLGTPFDPAEFYTQPHPLASAMVAWLDKLQVELPGAAGLKLTFEHIVEANAQAGKVVTIPKVTNVRLFRLRQQNAQHAQRIAQLRQGIAHGNAAQQGAVLLAQAEQLIAIAQEVNERQFAEIEEQRNAVVGEVLGEFQQLRAENAEVAARNEEIEAEAAELQQAAINMQRDIAQMEATVAQLRVAVEDMKNRKKDSGFASIVCVVIAVVVSVLIKIYAPYLAWTIKPMIGSSVGLAASVKT
jgi:hypothetical protein